MSSAFIEVAAVRDRLGEPRLRIVDARSRPHGGSDPKARAGRDLFRDAHVAGAIYLDYAVDLVDEATPYATRVAPADRFAEMMSRSGLGDDCSFVVYDDGNVPYAARFLWMCRYYGHDDVRILAGGFPAWRAANGPIAAGDAVAPERRTFTAHPRPTLRATRAEVEAIAAGTSCAQLLETQRNLTYAQRTRAVPNAKRLSGNDLLEDARGGRVAPPERLAALVADLALDARARTVVTCGSGVSASGSYVALLEAGFTDVAVYDGSWMEWQHDGMPTVEK